MEFESNAKAILRDNGYIRVDKKGRDITNITDFFKLNAPTKLNEYQITIPIWNGDFRTFNPFENPPDKEKCLPKEKWSIERGLSWYQDYNTVKHNRFNEFEKATLENATKAVGAVLAILFAQFNCYAFDHLVSSCPTNSNDYMFNNACLLGVKTPQWPINECYDFKWENILATGSSCQKYHF